MLVALSALAFASPLGAFQKLDFKVSGDDKALTASLEAASALRAARSEKVTDPQDVFAAARAEYGRLLAALYAQGHYSAVISVKVDGREAADIAPLDAPRSIDRVTVRVDPGPAFRFSRAVVAPLASDTTLPPGFRRGERADSGLISDAANAAVDGWRARGRAKADVAGQEIVADHRAARLDARIAITPGPVLRFGALDISGQTRMREARIRAIAGLPEGQPFHPATLERVAERLRRTGIFSSVALTENEAITPPDLLGIGLAVVEEKPRRYSFGAEISSNEGATVSAGWLHRNLFGGGERLEVKGEVAQIGAQTSGQDFSFATTLSRPATITPDTTASVGFEVGRLDEDDYLSDYAKANVSFTHYLSRKITLRAGLEYAYEDVTDVTGNYTYKNVSLPIGLTWENRDKPLDAKRGTYLDMELRPFVGQGDTGSGVRFTADARAYKTFGERVTLAGRAQLGIVSGPGLLETPREYLFFSGGGGTVRGQPYQSLGVSVLRNDFDIGGQAFLGMSAEARVRVTDRIGIVGFYDWAQIGGLSFDDGLAGSHAGAGLGLRYDAGFAPIRLDVAAPVSGNTGDGVQIYVGIGQSF